METGALVHAPTATELAGWRVRRTLLGLTLLVVAVLGLYLGVMGLTGGARAGGGAVVTTVLTLGASAAIGFFGLRYLMLGLKGHGVKLYERAVEADLFDGMRALPRRRQVPLLRVHVSGSSRLAIGQAITTTGHAFRLPPDLMERTDLWYLGSLGTSPLAPGGRDAREAFERGELGPPPKAAPPPARPNLGPPWPTERTRRQEPPGDVMVSVEVAPPGRPEEVPITPSPVTRPVATAVPARASIAAPARPALRPQRVLATEETSLLPPVEEGVGAIEDLPEGAPAPTARPRVTLPPAPEAGLPAPRPAVGPPATASVPRAPDEGADEWELEEIPPGEAAPPAPGKAPPEWDWEEI